jgi:hypothetical protein
VLLDLALLALAGALGIARLALRRRYKMRQQQGIKPTDLGHMAAATVAALACFHSPPGMAASVLITVLYIVYQVLEDRSAKDIAVYLGTFVAATAAKIGLPLAHIT